MRCVPKTTLIREPSSPTDPLNVLLCLPVITLYTRMLRSWHAVKTCFWPESTSMSYSVVFPWALWPRANCGGPPGT